MDCSFSLSARCHYQETAQNRDQPLHYSTDFEHNHFRKKTIIADSYKKRLQKKVPDIHNQLKLFD